MNRASKFSPGIRERSVKMAAKKYFLGLSILATGRSSSGSAHRLKRRPVGALKVAATAAPLGVLAGSMLDMVLGAVSDLLLVETHRAKAVHATCPFWSKPV